jgi:hypothetical protein
MNATVQLLDPGGNPLPIDSVTVTESVNEGWTWSATLPVIPRYAENKSLMDAFQGEAYRFLLTIESNGQELALPPLVATGYEEDVTGGGSISGVDEATFLLTRRRINLVGAAVTSGANIVIGIANRLGLSGSLLNLTGLGFNIEEVEQTATTAMLPHVNRICDICCREWAAQLGPGNTCDIRFYEIDIDAEPGTWQPDWSRVVRRRDTESRVASLHVVRCGRMTDALRILAHTPVGHMIPLTHWVVFQSPYSHLTLFSNDGTELGRGGSYIAGPDDPGVYYMRIDEDNPESFYVRGRSIQNVLAQPISATFRVDGVYDNRADETWEEDWMPGGGYAFSHKDTYLWRANRGTHTLDWDGPLCPGIYLGQVLTWPGQPNSRVDTYTHTIGAGSMSTRATSAVLAADQW